MSESRGDLQRSGDQFGKLPDKDLTRSRRPMGPGPGGRRPGGGMGLGVPGEKAKNFRTTMKTLLTYLKPYLFYMALVLILSVMSTIFMIIGPKLMGNATTTLFEGAVAKITNVPGAAIDFYSIGKIVLLLLILYGISSGCLFLQGFVMARVSNGMTYELRRRIAQKINRLPLKYFDTKSYGDVLSRITNDVDTISHTLNHGLSQIVASVTTIIGIAIMMFSISWLMSCVAILMLPMSLGLAGFVIRKSQKFYKKNQAYLGHVNGHVEEMYSGHDVMRAFNGEGKSIQEFDELVEELYGAAWKSQFFSGLMMPVTQLIGNIGYVAICILGGHLAINRVIYVGDIQAFIQYVRSFNQPISQVAGIANIMQSTAAAAERVFEFLDEEEEVSDVSLTEAVPDVTGRVEFKDVCFGYKPDKIIIENFSADIKAGTRIAIVGPTGAGKTTMVKLLMRFYDVNEGSILVDGIDIRDYPRNELRKNFGMVLQDTWLFKGSVMENIRHGRLDATDEEVYRAAGIAHVDQIINTLPKGYKMELNEDADNLARGEKQLLTIARAVLADPAILILDEATSSVDTRTERLIQQAVEEIMKDRTSFIIAHRLSTIRNADLILVMRDGAIVEQGCHDDLLKADGFYASLYNSQFEDRLEDVH